MINIDDPFAWAEALGRVAEAIEKPYRARVAKIIDRWWRRVAIALENGGNIERVDATADLAAAISALYTRAGAVYTRLYIEQAAEATGRDDLKALLDIDFIRKAVKDEIRARIAQWIKVNALEQSKLINNSMLQRARAIIARGVMQGKTLPQIATELARGKALSRRGLKRLRLDPRKAAKMIVRTEVARAHSQVQQEILKEVGKENFKSKQWLTVGDDRVRATHRSVTGADGVATAYDTEEVDKLRVRRGPRGGRRFEKVPGAKTLIQHPRIPIDADFIVGGERAAYPRDPRLSAKEVINCRCSAIYFEAGVPRKGRRRRPPVPSPE